MIRTCLKKSAEERWQSVADVRLVLQSIAEDAGYAPPETVQASRKKAWRWAALAAVLLLITLGSLFIAWRSSVRDSARVSIRTAILPPAGAAFNFFNAHSAPPEISPDGQKVVFRAISDGRPVLFVRSLTTDSPRLLAGTEDGRYPFWSPDSRGIGFFADGKIKKIEWSG